MSKTKMSCEVESVQGGFFPLRVLDKAGLSRRLDPEAYQVPIHYKNYEQRVEKIERSILSAERGLKRKKDPSLAILKRKTAKALAEKAGVKLELPPEQLALKDDISAVIDLGSDSDDENLRAPCALLCVLHLSIIGDDSEDCLHA